MDLRDITEKDLRTLDWTDAGDGLWRIIADVTCDLCGAYQAADSDPIHDKILGTHLCVRLYNSVGWRADEHHQLLCPDCAVRQFPPRSA